MAVLFCNGITSLSLSQHRLFRLLLVARSIQLLHLLVDLELYAALELGTVAKRKEKLQQSENVQISIDLGISYLEPYKEWRKKERLGQIILTAC